jgi:toxin-antitoxin system PIN domain toxin
VIVPDANLLLYAYDSRSPFHTRARDWWRGCLDGDEPVGLTDAVAFAFIRISTSARVYEQPLTVAEAAGHVRLWLARRVVRMLLPEVDHAERVIALLEEAGGAGGNLVTDAQIAALALRHQAEVHTADRDFLRFRALRCRFPLDGR